MQRPNDEAPLCTLCEKNPATERYMLSGHAETVCAACLERRQVRDSLEDKILHIIGLERRKQYDEALACLDTILEENRDRDHDGWLARSVALHRTSILLDAGRYAESEVAHNEWARIGFEDVWRRQLHALGMAKTLEALARDREAVAVLEDVLGYEDPNDPLLALTALIELLRISDKLALPVDSKWLRIAEAVAERHGVDMPVSDVTGETILALMETVRSMQRRRPGEAE